MAWMAIRVRGGIHARHDLVMTMDELRLTRPNHMTIVPETPSFRGMLDKVQGYITWGPVKQETVALLIKERGVSVDRKPVGKKDSEDLSAKAIQGGMRAVPQLLPLFRLKAPRGGWKSTKKPFTMGGALGFRQQGAKDDMDALARRMI